MRKVEIFKEISEKTGIEKDVVESIIEVFMDSVQEHVSSKERVSLYGFGNFITKKRAPKIARNISKNIIMHLPAYYTPVFKPSKRFSKRLKNMQVQSSEYALGIEV